MQQPKTLESNAIAQPTPSISKSDTSRPHQSPLGHLPVLQSYVTFWPSSPSIDHFPTPRPPRHPRAWSTVSNRGRTKVAEWFR